MKNRPFYFRHFVIRQDRCAMKVGMDSMILGAYVQPGNANNILDIGTGTGVLALMLAQKSNARIDAIEIDSEAAIQAEENIQASSWRSRIRVYNTSLQEFKATESPSYDLIVSNPPYFNPFTRKQHDTSSTRHDARSHTQLSFEDLIAYAGSLLSREGRLYIVIPYEAKERLLIIAAQQHLYLSDCLHIGSRKDKPIIRAVLGLGFRPEPTKEHTLFIYQSQGLYTEEYIHLTCSYHAMSLARPGR